MSDEQLNEFLNLLFDSIYEKYPSINIENDEFGRDKGPVDHSLKLTIDNKIILISIPDSYIEDVRDPIATPKNIEECLAQIEEKLK